jgi:dTDP-4-amino-4,6-dideoxygalactose transaminase
VTIPSEPNWSRGNYHLYVIRTQQRDELQKLLTEKQIGTGLHYPIPCHLQKGYEYLGYDPGAFPVAEQLALEVLSLPMYPQIQKQHQEQVANELQEFELTGSLMQKARNS